MDGRSSHAALPATVDDTPGQPVPGRTTTALPHGFPSPLQAPARSRALPPARSTQGRVERVQGWTDHAPAPRRATPLPLAPIAPPQLTPLTGAPQAPAPAPSALTEDTNSPPAINSPTATSATPAASATPAQPDAGAQVVRRLALEVGEEPFERYFLGQTRLAMREGALVVTAATDTLTSLLERRFREHLLRATGASSVRFQTDKAIFRDQPPRDAREGQPRDGASRALGAPAPRAKARLLRPRHTLDQFMVGVSNRLAYTAVRRLVEADDVTAPVFLHGSCGLGKTHLLQGAAALFQKLRPGAHVRVVTGEQFTNEFIASLRAGKIDQFRRACRGAELLCLDDVHFVANKDATQSELLHTLDAAGLSGCRVLIASDEHPRHIAKLSEKLVSRFLGCVVVRVESPDPKLRRELVAHLASRRGLALSPQAVEVIAQRSCRAVGTLAGFGGSVREIEGLINQVEAVSGLLDANAPRAGGVRAVEADAVRCALGLDGRGADTRPAPQQASGPRRPIPVRVIVEQVCKALCVDLAEFAGSGRHKRVVLARSIAACLSRELTTQSFPEIARAMGRSNHSTIITAQKRLEKELASPDPRVLDAEDCPSHPGLTIRELMDQVARDVRALVR